MQIKRYLNSDIISDLGFFPVVYINGPRQAGKTTLAQQWHFLNKGSVFLSFDRALEKAAASRNPLNYIESSGTPLIIDEVQLVPEVFRSIKLIVDQRRFMLLQEGRRASGLFLLTGSANLLAFPALADAMVGRMSTRTLLPLSVAESLEIPRPKFIESLFEKKFSDLDKAVSHSKKIPLLDAISRATFPELLSLKPEQAQKWYENYVQKVTLEDPLQTYNLEKANFMPILLQTLAMRAGSLINDASTSREIGLNAVTTRSYRALLNSTFVTYSLKPWYRNVAKRLVKANKLYFYDTQLLCYLLGETPKDLLQTAPGRFGHVLENFVLTELLKAIQFLDQRVSLSFYRTSEGNEVDFVLEKQGKLVAIEVKNSERITEKDLKGIKELKSIAEKEFVCGIVLCNTSRVIAFDKDIYLVPFSALWS